MSLFKERFRQERISKGITQKSLSEILGVDRTSISKYENGKQLPEVPVLEKMANYFDVSTDYLLGKTDKRNIESKKEINGIEKENDIDKKIDEILQEEQIYLCGEPLSEEDRMLLEDSIRSTIELAKKIMNKK